MKKFDRSKVNSPKSALAVSVATALGSGFFPIAPGTAGTLMGMPLAYLTIDWPAHLRALLWIAVLALGTWSAKVFDETMGSNDNQHIVIDEVVGIGITSFTAMHSVTAWWTAFVLFRIFDVIKLPPARQLDRWSKTGSAWRGGFGVMADDVAAGFHGLIVMLLLQHWGIL